MVSKSVRTNQDLKDFERIGRSSIYKLRFKKKWLLSVYLQIYFLKLFLGQMEKKLPASADLFRLTFCRRINVSRMNSSPLLLKIMLSLLENGMIRFLLRWDLTFTFIHSLFSKLLVLHGFCKFLHFFLFFHSFKSLKSLSLEVFQGIP